MIYLGFCYLLTQYALCQHSVLGTVMLHVHGRVHILLL